MQYHIYIIIFYSLLFYYYIKNVKSTLNFITKSVNIVYKLLGSRKFATKTIYLLTFLFYFLVANYIFLSPFNLYEREEINIIEKDLNKILGILKVIVKDQQYSDDLTLIKNLIVKINQMLNDEINITDDFLDGLDKDLNYLDQKYFAQLVYLKNEYVELNDIVRIFAPIQNYYKKKNHEMYVEKLREKNRKKREEAKND